MPTKLGGEGGRGEGGLVHLIMSDTNAYKGGRGGGVRRTVIRPFLVVSVCELQSETSPEQKRAPLIDQNEEYTHRMYSPVRGLSHCLSR